MLNNTSGIILFSLITLSKQFRNRLLPGLPHNNIYLGYFLADLSASAV
jgi:hypothetical protein